jgi:hypothetical protein
MGSSRSDNKEFDKTRYQHYRLQEEPDQTKYANLNQTDKATLILPLGFAAIEKAKLFSKTAPKGKT